MKKIFMVQAALLPVLLCCMLSAQPTLQFQRNFGGTGYDTAYCIRQTIDRGYIIAGSTTSGNGDVTSNHGGIDYWIVKLNSTGNIVWQKTFGGSATDIAKSIQQTTDGGYIVAGISNSADGNLTGLHGISNETPQGMDPYYYPPPYCYEPWIIKLDATGNITWSQCYHNSYYEGAGNITEFFDNFATGIIQTSDGGYLMGGKETRLPDDPSGSGYYPSVTKLSSGGGVSWQNRFYDYASISVADLVQTPSGYTVLGNGTWFDNIGGDDTYVYALDNSGAIVWNHNYGGTANDRGSSIKRTTDGGFIVAGYTASTDIDLAAAGNHGSNDFWMFKLNSVGTLAWSKCYGGTGSDVAKGVQQGADGNYYVSGYSLSSNGNVTDHYASATPTSDFWTVKTSSSGTLIWSKSYGGTNHDAAFSLEKTMEGGFIVAGTSASVVNGVANKGLTDLQLFKFFECSSLLAPIAYSQNFCSATNPTVANLVATGSGLKWYNVSAGGTALASGTLLVTGTYYVTQTSVGCESPRAAITVKVYTTPAAPAATAQTFCASASPKVSNLVATGTSLKWYTVSAGGTALALTMVLSTRTYYVSQTSNGCESSRRSVAVTVNTGCRVIISKPQKNSGVKSNIASLSVYPNPGSGIFTVSLKGIYAEKATLQLTDIYGKLLLQKNCTPVGGNISEKITAGRLPSGTYFISCIAGSQKINTRVVIQK